MAQTAFLKAILSLYCVFKTVATNSGVRVNALALNLLTISLVKQDY